MDFTSEAAFADTVDRANRLVRERAQDAAAALTALAGLNAADPAGRLTHRLDLDRAAVIGFSLGGATAAEACWLDPRFKAAINMDGWHFADVLQHGVAQPYLVMSDAGAPTTAEDLASTDPLRRHTSTLNQRDADWYRRNVQLHGGLYLTIAETAHVNFSDEAFRSPIRHLTSAGPIDPRLASRIVATYATAFLRAALLGQASPLLDQGNRAFPEAQLQVWPRPAASTKVNGRTDDTPVLR
jgi:dienelactone hydrolase